ncbi:SapB/AmfS family lanthipeptide [Streptomyces sp. NPDC048172]
MTLLDLQGMDATEDLEIEGHGGSHVSVAHCNSSASIAVCA